MTDLTMRELDLPWCRKHIPGFAKFEEQAKRAEQEKVAHNAEHDTGERPGKKEDAE
jgi:hypothetical protein